MESGRTDDDLIAADLAYRLAGKRIAFVGFFLLFIPAALLGYWVSRSETGAIIGGAIAAIGMIATNLNLCLTECPRCRHLLFLDNNGRKKSMFASRCWSCGLSFSTSPTERPHAEGSGHAPTAEAPPTGRGTDDSHGSTRGKDAG